MKPATEIKTSHPSRLRSVLAIALFACSPMLAQAKDGGYLNHEAEPQKGDLYAGHFLKKEYAQSRIVNLRDYSNNTWITLEGNIISHPTIRSLTPYIHIHHHTKLRRSGENIR